MNGLMASLLLLLASGVLSLHPRLGARAGVWGCVAGCLLGMVSGVRVLFTGEALSWRMAWGVPGGSFYLHCDPLSALFLVPILLVSALGAVYGSEYMRNAAPRGHWLFYNLLVAGMAAVVLAWNAVFFLVAWEVMALASFFLVATEDEKPAVRDAAWLYLVATHIGTACLMVLFAMAGAGASVLDFDQLTLSRAGDVPWFASVLFLLALAGFGTKAGVVPFHVWLPEAHPAAPSHVSALMSGVMIKTGVYGIVRVLAHAGPPPWWWGVALIGLGLFSGIGGVLFALAQHDLKRLLAYCSVENMGVILLGLGIGAMGWSAGEGRVCLLGFAGALLHVVNHSLFKSLLFFGAGAVAHAAHTLDLNSLGGLFKRMPRIGGPFLAGSAAISGLPPFNGFISEALIFLAGITAVMSADAALCSAGAAVVAGLALLSGLAVACFTKAFGGMFLGEPRDECARQAHDPGWRMWIPGWVLMLACLGIGLGMGPLLAVYGPRWSGLWPGNPALFLSVVRDIAALLTHLTLGLTLFIGLCGGLAGLRLLLLRGRGVRESVTWDCGYAAPSARMQYTPSSFSQPLVDMFRMVLRTRAEGGVPAGLFADSVTFATCTEDVVRSRVFYPLFAGLLRVMAAVRRLQHGSLQVYVLYIALTLLFLMLWELG